jgi:hypothetical protein
MKESPILFSNGMVKAIIAGRKTMTRRITKDNCDELIGYQYVLNNPTYPEYWKGKKSEPYTGWIAKFSNLQIAMPRTCPYGQAGDILWVREAFNIEQIPVAPEGDHDELLYYYKATEKVYTDMKWKPSIHMPKQASRIWLQVTDIKVERLHDMTQEDAIAEGVEKKQGSGSDTIFDFKHYGYGSYDVDAKVSYRTLWDCINGNDSWFQNPWVWVISFKVLSTTGKPAGLKQLTPANNTTC